MKKAFSRVLLPVSFVLFSILFFLNTARAQDSIVLVNNSVILAKVEEIDVDNIKYHKADNISGPLYDLPKSQIYEIIYINGTVDVMNPQTQNNPGQLNNPGQQNTQVNNNAAAQFDQAPANNQTQQPNQAQQPAQAQQNNAGQQDNNYYQQQTQQNNNVQQQDGMLGPNTQYKVPQEQEGPVTVQTFYDQLSPYGSWVNSPAYGYVWVPNVGPDFVPYGTAGHWAFTEYGWTWVSDFPWGWAAFHYGRWYYDYYMGYVWIPTTQWGPAWVSWRSNDGFYGWAPMGPRGYEYPRDRWVFVNSGYITSERVYEHHEPRENVTVIYNNTTVIQNNYVERNGMHYVAGPDRREVERVTHTTIAPERIVTTNKPGETMHANGQITMYHPVHKPQNNAVPARPAQVTPSEQVTPPAQRTTVVHPVVNQEHFQSAPQQPANNNHTQPQEHNNAPAGNFNNNNTERQPQRTEPAQQQYNNRIEGAPEQHQAPRQEETKPAQQQTQQRPVQQQPRPAQQPKPARQNTPKPAPQQPEKKK